MELATSLLEKYSKAGPRYTSYPTAPYFTEAFGEKEWLDELNQTQSSGRDMSLYVHIPFCDTLCYYCGCNMVATHDYSKAETYLGYLFQEIDRVAALTSPERLARQVHWGGGTPTFLKPADIRRLFQHLASRFNIAPDAEISCELDPRELSREHIEALAQSGFNRASMGVQDLDEKVQKAVNRVQPEELILQVYGWLREAGFNSINIDLMVGLPHQTVESFSITLDKMLALGPDRLAVFNYAHVPWMKKHQKLIIESDLPDLPTKLALQKLMMERLADAGYVYIGMDHFAKADDEIVMAQQSKTLYRNFQGYTTNKDCDIYAFGVSAISQTAEVYVQNAKNLAEYQRRIASGGLATERGLRISRDDMIRREAISGIMCDLELDKAKFGGQWNIEFDTFFADALDDLKDLAADGLVTLEPGIIRVTEIGRIFLRNIAMPFDAYLRQQTTETKPRYSKTL
ncbi:MAG: oxygen-independent coproporphyrinogen III oxidase [Sulfurimicrobium sp.]|nr:oxygen-independent coproporphyrinogen III oxidase [Sulfurimicrobium sp.]MDP1704014.1 oxygen-independent coproporphyrinogen III oxidase [Sulfurimicrobium sp.]MDP2199471.1 oxygen-independent coproporphyrinogen III oxidase [Sulfurimicrobium sp.]MDP3687955.1 oxygen-independent coproporphyrinogen III oxidase [Sulfurimicrobium sp.]